MGKFGDARKNKNDEFYTQLSDISSEIRNYKKHFKDKVVLLNCDDPKWSNFYVYFAQNFEHLGLKKLIATHYSEDKSTYKLEINRDENGDGKINALDTIETPLIGNGDFRSPECIDLLREADIVVTNPPFSLFREYIALLQDMNKKFLVVGNNNAVTYKDIFQLIKNGDIWLGFNSNKTMEYEVPSGYKAQRVDDNGKSFVKVPAISWFTNLEHNKRNESIPLFKSYTPEEYPKYDNYNAIDVSKVNEIPFDYDGFMGVPITFLCKFNPSQFEIFGITNTGEINEGIRLPNTPHGRAVVDGKEIYRRILIKRK